jgi:large subunit ribosomal protein L4
MAQIINSLKIEKTALLAIPARNEVIEKSASNLPKVKSILVDYLNVKDLLKYNTLVLLKDSLVNLDNLAK